MNRRFIYFMGGMESGAEGQKEAPVGSKEGEQAGPDAGKKGKEAASHLVEAADKNLTSLLPTDEGAQELGAKVNEKADVSEAARKIDTLFAKNNGKYAAAIVEAPGPEGLAKVSQLIRADLDGEKDIKMMPERAIFSVPIRVGETAYIVDVRAGGGIGADVKVQRRESQS